MSPTRLSLLRNIGLIAVGFIIALLITNRRTERPVAATTPNQTSGETVIEVAPDTGRSGFDPLSQAEMAQAEKIGLAALVNSREKTPLNPNVPTNAQLEVIKIERHEENKAVYAGAGWDRRADVVIYDYGRDQLLVQVVNLTTGKLDSSDTAKGVQPQPTARETARALQLVLDHPQAGPAVRGQYQQISGKSLIEAKQITARGLAFYSEPTAAAAVLAADCGVHRCVQLLLSTDQNVVLDATPIVDLSTGRFINLNK